jgi:methionyl-tRNA synthetase
VHRYRDGRVPVPAERAADGQYARDRDTLLAVSSAAPQRVAAGLDAFDFRAATAAIWDVVEAANRYVEQTEPWRLARAERDGDPAAGERLDEVLALLVSTCARIGRLLAPFLPGLAAKIQTACDDSAGELPPAQPVFPRLELASPVVV